MNRVYATACEKDGKNFFTVPAKRQEAVRAIIEADGFVINRRARLTDFCEDLNENRMAC